MKVIKQLLRQPMKNLFQILTAALAVAVLCLCLSQSLAAQKTEAELEYKYTTVALTTANWNFKYRETTDAYVHTGYMNPDVAAWIQEKIKENPDLVETVAHSGLASAYIPALTLDNHTQNRYQPYYYGDGWTMGTLYYDMISGDSTYAPSYSHAMFVVTLDQFEEPTQTYSIIYTSSGEVVQQPGLVWTTVYGHIDQVLGLEAGYEDPTGQSIQMTLYVETMEAFDALELAVGEQFMVYGRNYCWAPAPVEAYIEEQLENFKRTDPVVAEYLGSDYDKALLHYLTEEEKTQFAKTNPNYAVPEAIYGDTAIITEPPEMVTETQGENTVSWYRLNCILLYKEQLTRTETPGVTIWNDAAMRAYSSEDGSLLETREITENGETVTISWEEYKERYGIPTIAKLEGTAEEFLAANEAWQTALHNIEMNYHTFAVIGVEKLNYIPDFARGMARVTQGRDFTQEELASGAKVCILSEQLAQRNGLQVGDTIDPQFYNYDYNITYQDYISKGRNTLLPSAYYYNEHTEFAGEAEAYTIIGLYRQDDAWGDVGENIYAFTPNTIFVPEASVTSDMDYGEQGVFRTIILKNGCIEEFDAIVSNHDFEPIYGMEEMRELFVYYDQGYSQVKDSFYNYQELSKQVMIVGFVVYGIVLALFLLLYVARQGSTLRTMASLGTPRGKKILYVLGSALGILVPGTLLGAGLTLVLWGPVVSRLLTAGGAAFSLSLDLGLMALIVAAQLALAMAVVLLMAIPMTRNKGLMKRK